MTNPNMTVLIQTLASFAGARFASLTYKTKEKTNKAGIVTQGGEIARYNLILGANYNSCVKDSLLELQLMDIKEFYQITFAQDTQEWFGVTLDHFIEARNELLASFQKTLDSHEQGQQNPDYTKVGMYQPIIKGLNVNLNDQTFQLFGLLQSKILIKKGVFHDVISAEKTLAKNAIRQALKVGKFREFAMDYNNAITARMEGEILVFN